MIHVFLPSIRDEAAQLRRSKRSTSRVAFRITVKIYMHVEYHIPSGNVERLNENLFPGIFFSCVFFPPFFLFYLFLKGGTI